MVFMTPLNNFSVNLQAAEQLLKMYAELRKSRGLGARGSLDKKNSDLTWLPRSSVVASISALDNYIHDVLYDRIPVALTGDTEISKSLAESMATLMPIKNDEQFRAARTLLKSHSTLEDLSQKLRSKKLQFESYQSPDKILAAYRLIGFDDVFEAASALWQGPDTSADSIKRELSKYAERRNKIAHEGDLEHKSGTPRPMRLDYASRCKQFVAILVGRLDQIVYP